MKIINQNYFFNQCYLVKVNLIVKFKRTKELFFVSIRPPITLIAKEQQVCVRKKVNYEQVINANEY